MAIARRSTPTGGHVHRGDLPLWVETSGEGPPLLLITGLGYATWAWTDVREALGPHWRLIAMDNRGTGRSGKPAGPYSIEEMADDAVAVLDALGLSSAHVLGHSMGGYIAQTLTARHPERVRSLILVATSPGGPGSHPVPAETIAAWQAAAGLPPPAFARRTMPISYTLGWSERHPDRFEVNLRHRLEFPTPAACWAAQFAACERFLAQGIDPRTLDRPALVIHGEEDRVVPHANGARLARELPRARLVSIPGAGHLWFLEEPEAFARAVMEHLVSEENRR